MINNDKYITTVGKNADPNDNSGLPTWAVERVRQCYEVCSEKNVIPPVVANLDNLPATISQIEIETGVESPFDLDETGKMNFATTWSIAPANDVGNRVCTYLFDGGSGYSDVNLTLTELNLSTLTKITGIRACEDMCRRCVSLQHAPLTNVVEITGDYAADEMFFNCVNLEETGLDNLEVIGLRSCQSMYQGCEKITSTGLHKLRTIGSAGAFAMFKNNAALTDICMENVETINGAASMFSGCKNLKIARFYKLKTIGGSAFSSTFENSGIKQIFFYNLENVFVNSFGTSATTYMLSGCNNVTVHFPTSLQSTMSGWTSVQEGFGGTNTLVLFDLGIEATITAPLGSIVWVNATQIFDGTQETTTITEMIPDGEVKVVAVDRETGAIVQTTMTVSESNPNIVIDFDNYEYGYVQPVVAEGIVPNCSAKLYNEYIQGGVDIPWRNDGTFKGNIGTTVYLYVTAQGYEQANDVTATFADGTQYVEIPMTQILIDETYDYTNFEQVITVDGYWSVYGGYLMIHPTIATIYRDSKGIVTILPEGVSGVRVTVTGYTSSEANYDFGFVSYGTEQVNPTAAEIKNQTIANGGYVFRQSGVYSSPVTVTRTFTDSDLVSAGEKVITIGWGQDSSTSGGNNTLYIESIRIQAF